MTLATATEDALLAWLLGTPFPAPPAGLWLALHSAAEPAPGNEIKGWAGGDRLPVTAADFAAPVASASGGRERTNARALMLGVHSAPQTVMSFALWNAQTNGTIELTGDVAPDFVVAAGDPPVFLTGDLTLKVS